MSPILAFLPALACSAYITAGVLSLRVSPALAMRAARAAGLVSILAAAAAVIALMIGGPLQTPTYGAGTLGIAFRIDALSAAMFAVIAFVGLIVLEFSRRYLAGQDRQATFFGLMSLTIAAALAVATAGNLVQLCLAWVATSLTLHRLLLFFGDRPRAVIAARKKFVVARLGDVALIVATICLWRQFDTGNIADILSGAGAMRATAGFEPGVALAAALIAIAALLKSAQFPTHGWLTEVMETPTPVSALLHAGIVNGGGFIVFRFADVMVMSPGAMQLLIIVGGFTALFGSLAMLTQTSIKVSLGYSTVGQMGFMLLQCGLGAFSSAALHLVAHSLYKAHAFLASGTAVDAILADNKAPEQSASLTSLLLSLVGALLIYASLGLAFGPLLDHSIAIYALGAIFTLGLFVFIARDSGRNVLARVLPAAAISSLLYYALQIGAQRVFAGLAPVPPETGPAGFVLIALVLVSFATTAVMQVLAPGAAGRRMSAAYVHLSNGLYVNALFNRLTGAMRRETH